MHLYLHQVYSIDSTMDGDDALLALLDACDERPAPARRDQQGPANRRPNASSECKIVPTNAGNVSHGCGLHPAQRRLELCCRPLRHPALLSPRAAETPGAPAKPASKPQPKTVTAHAPKHYVEVLTGIKVRGAGPARRARPAGALRPRLPLRFAH